MVRVLGTACGLGVEGSGWVAAPGLVVTNAHVVAGEDDTTVTTQRRRVARRHAGPLRPRQRPRRCCASTADAAGAAARRRAPSRGAAAAPSSATPRTAPTPSPPARFGETRDVISEDSYGQRPDPALDQLACAARVRSGNSGGPMVDARGRVLGTVFATTTYGNPGGFAIPDDDRRRPPSARPGPRSTRVLAPAEGATRYISRQ